MIVACPECNGQVSDSAPACPHCGFVRVVQPTQPAAPTTVVVQSTKPGFFDPGANCRGCLIGIVVLPLFGLFVLFVLARC